MLVVAFDDGTPHRPARGAPVLRKNRRFNEFDGLVIGTLSLMSFSLYRVVHQTHHAYLATERDYEFWPLSQTTMPRWTRCLAAFSELNLGLFYSPFLFLRAFFSSPSPVRSKRVRRRIWAELALTVVTWTLILWAIAGFGLWRYFIWMYLAPAVLAANLQNWRKYTSPWDEGARLMAQRGASSRKEVGAVALTLLHETVMEFSQRAGYPTPFCRNSENCSRKDPGSGHRIPGIVPLVELMPALPPHA